MLRPGRAQQGSRGARTEAGRAGLRPDPPRRLRTEPGARTRPAGSAAADPLGRAPGVRLPGLVGRPAGVAAGLLRPRPAAGLRLPLPRHPGQGLGATAGRAQRRPAGLPRPAAVAAALPQGPAGAPADGAQRARRLWQAPPAAWKSSRRCAVPARNSARAGCVAPNSSAARSSSLPARLRPGADTDRSDRSATFPPASLPRPHGGPLPASTGSQCGCRPLCIPQHPSGMGSESDRPVTFGRDLKPAPRARISPLRNESGSGKKDLS